MKSRFLLSMLVIICVTLLSGCVSLDARKQADSLQQSVRAYSSALRWARYQDAIKMHVTRDLKYAEVDIEYLENFSVTSFEIISQSLVPSSEEDDVMDAIIVAEISYFHKGKAYVKKLKLNQTWWYNTEFKHWLIESDFPEFK